jgi:methyl-accepting chemotaxis protein
MPDSIKKRFLTILLPWSIIGLLIIIASTYYLLEKTKKEVHHLKVAELRNILDQRVKSIHKRGGFTASALSNSNTVIRALKTKKKKLLINEYNDLTRFYKEKLNIPHIKIHVHTAKGISFLRSWNKDKNGDDLTYFRKAIPKVKNSRKVLNTFEVGKIGLAFRSISPIINKSTYYGSLEFIQDFDTLNNKFKKDDTKILTLLHSKYLPIASGLKDNKKLGEYIINQNDIDKNLVEELKLIDIKLLLKNKYAVTDKNLITFSYIRDFRDRPIGLFILAEDIHSVEYLTKKHSMDIYTLFAVGLGVFILLIIMIYITLKQRLQFIETEDD